MLTWIYHSPFQDKIVLSTKTLPSKKDLGKTVVISDWQQINAVTKQWDAASFYTHRDARMSPFVVGWGSHDDITLVDKICYIYGESTERRKWYPLGDFYDKFKLLNKELNFGYRNTSDWSTDFELHVTTIKYNCQFIGCYNWQTVRQTKTISIKLRGQRIDIYQNKFLILLQPSNKVAGR